MQTIWFSVKFNNAMDNVVDSDPDVVQDKYEEGESEAILVLPDAYDPEGAPVPLVFSAHGSGGRVSKEENKRGGIGYMSSAIENGYAVFDIHGTRPDGRSYGNRRYVEAVHRAYVYITKNYNVDPRLFVMGASMGGVCALNFVNFYPDIVRAIGLFFPRTNLNTVELNGVPFHGSFDVGYREKKNFSVTEIISEEYRFDEIGVWQNEKTVGLNPWFNRTITIDGVRYATLPCPIKIWHGDEDVSVDYNLSVEFIAALRRTGCYAELRTMKGRGHKHTDVMHEEVRLWFDRFR